MMLDQIKKALSFRFARSLGTINIKNTYIFFADYVDPGFSFILGRIIKITDFYLEEGVHG
jgi:hypothetical protein